MKNKEIFEYDEQAIIRKVNGEIVELVGTKDKMRDIFFTLEVLCNKKSCFMIHCEGNISPYALGERYMRINAEQAGEILSLKDRDKQWEFMNYLSTP